MRILYSHYLSDLNHPAARMTQQIGRELQQLGHDVKLYASDRSAEKKSPSTLRNGGNPGVGSRQERTTSWLRRKLWFSKRMFQNRQRFVTDCEAIREFQPDIILARQDAYCWSVARAAKKINVPLVTYADAPVAYETRLFNDERRWHPHGVVERIERWTLQQSQAIITVSHPAAELLKRYRLKVPIHVNPNGIDPQTFQQNSVEERRQLRSVLGIPEDQLVIGFQGTFRSFHGIDRLTELIHRTAERSGVTWLLVGDGPQLPALRAEIDGRHDVIVMGKRLPDEMPGLLSVMDIAVAPHARMDGTFYFCPLKILEYAATGCATLASRQGDIPFLLADGTAGEIVDADDVEAWARQLDVLIDDRERRLLLAKRARDHVMKNLTWQQTAMRVERVLASVLGIEVAARTSNAEVPETPVSECSLTNAS